MERLEDTALESWPVEDDAGFLGMVRVRDVEAALVAGDGDAVLRMLFERDGSDGVHSQHFAHLHGDQPLGQALARMGETHHTVLPVVSRANVRILLGIVTLPDILEAYGVERAEQVHPAELSGHG